MATSSFPMVTCNLALTLSAAVVQDLNTVWLQSYSGFAGFLVNAIAESDTTIDLSHEAANTLSAGTLQGVTVGTALLIENEPVVVTAINGTTLTVNRYAAAYPFMQMLPQQPKASHAANAPVNILTYIDPWEMIASAALRPWTQAQVNALGAKSATFGTYASGSLSIPGSTA